MNLTRLKPVPGRSPSTRCTGGARLPGPENSKYPERRDGVLTAWDSVLTVDMHEASPTKGALVVSGLWPSRSAFGVEDDVGMFRLGRQRQRFPYFAILKLRAWFPGHPRSHRCYHSNIMVSSTEPHSDPKEPYSSKAETGAKVSLTAGGPLWWKEDGPELLHQRCEEGGPLGGS